MLSPRQKSLKEPLVGSWTLVSFEVTNKDGTKQQTFGPNPWGMLILDAGGKYAQM
jgi:Lipocalin-like domain